MISTFLVSILKTPNQGTEGTYGGEADCKFLSGLACMGNNELTRR